MVSSLDLGAALQGWVVVLAGALLILALAAYRRSGQRRMLLLGAAFGLFLVKGVLTLLALYGWAPFPLASPLPLAGSALLDTGILLAFYLATLRLG